MTRKQKIMAGGVAIALIVVGFSCGALVPASESSSTTTVASPAPAETVTETITETETETVTEVPAACIEALNAGDTGFGYAARGFYISAYVVDDLVAGNMAAVSRKTDKLSNLAGRLKGTMNTYWTASDKCRNAAG